MSKIISVAPGFQYSVNLAYDLNNAEKIKSFIPTNAALYLLAEILISTNANSTNRARTLVGAYGRGKSHIILVLLSILMQQDFLMDAAVLKKNPGFANLIKSYYGSAKKILPVVINGSNASLTQSFILALQRTLTENDFQDIMPETNYKAAVKVIERWKNDFKDTFEQFQKIIGEPVEQFIDQLNQFDATAYGQFEKIYPTLTGGSNFNPFLNFDVVELYESVAQSLTLKGYGGLYVIYDEFSKFLEANIDSASVSDIKMIQDFAEKCNRSGELQLHLMLISHKEISNYFDKLPRQKLDGWRGVSERFKHIHLNNNFSQIYEIISAAINKKSPEWENFLINHGKNFIILKRNYENHRIFSNPNEDIATIIKGCYPLHPVSTFILPRLSEKIAQNERTLFTFLASDGVDTLQEFLNCNDDKDFNLILPDQLYNYFETLLKKEIYSGEIYKIYTTTCNILNQLEGGTLAAKIIKTISLIYMVGHFERLQPTRTEIIEIYSSIYNISDVEDALDELISKKFALYLNRSNNFLRLKNSSGVDIKKQIQNMLECQKINPRDILNAANFDNYLYPYRYNEEHEMTRYFDIQFIDSAEVDSDTDWNLKSDTLADGVIYAILPKNSDEIKTLANLLQEVSKNYMRFVFVLPKTFKEINQFAEEYQAIITLQAATAEDELLFEEYEVVREDLDEFIKNFIESYTQPEKFEAIYIHGGEVLNLRRRADLTALISNICEETFSKTPLINNEMLNKNELTTPAANSRRKIIDALLKNVLELGLGFRNTMQEASMVRATLVNTGILINGDTVQINLQPSDKNMAFLLQIIESHILKNDAANFAGLYEKLISPNYKIGLRRGLIPIYIAAVLHKYRRQIIISDNMVQLPLNAETLTRIDVNPENFTIEYFSLDSEHENYLNQLSEIFSSYAIESDKECGEYDFVANAMRRWYMSLPKYSRENKNLPPEYLRFTNLLRQNFGAAELLLKKVPDMLGLDSLKIEIIKKSYDETIFNLKNFLIEEMKNIFAPPNDLSKLNQISLKSVLLDWLESLDEKTFEKLFEDGTDKFLSAVRNITDDEDEFICQIAKIAVGLNIEDWDAETQGIFILTLQQYKNSAENLPKLVTVDSPAYQIIFDNGCNSFTKTFEKTEVTPRGKLLLNQINYSLNSAGQAISENEKRQILIEILTKMCW